MTLSQIYENLVSNKITEEQAATMLGMPVKSLRIRRAKLGDKLPQILGALDKINEDAITRTEAVEILKVSARQVNKLAESWGVSRPLKQYVFTRTASKIKWEIRKKFAIDYISGSANLEDAADGAEVTVRQMRRWIAELLMKHYGMPWKDLNLLTDDRRRRLADEIEEAEGLELAKQNVINAISTGKKTLLEEAEERVAAKLGRTRKRNV
jgi:hypothetical protein